MTKVLKKSPALNNKLILPILGGPAGSKFMRPAHDYMPLFFLQKALLPVELGKIFVDPGAGIDHIEVRQSVLVTSLFKQKKDLITLVSSGESGGYLYQIYYEYYPDETLEKQYLGVVIVTFAPQYPVVI